MESVIAKGPDRLQLPGGDIVRLPHLDDVVKQAKVFGWQIWRDVNPSVGQVLRVHCTHGHGPNMMFQPSVDLARLADVNVPKAVDLYASTMHYTTDPVNEQERTQVHVWRGQCYDCGNRHIGFSAAPEWVMGLNIIRYAVETDDINLTDWMERMFSIWSKWVSEAPPAQLARQLTEWAREDIERYG